MKSTYQLFLCAAIAILSFSSCQKEVSFSRDADRGNGNGNGNGGTTDDQTIIGKYQFVGDSITTTTIVEASELGEQIRSETRTGYTTENNAGTVEITDTVMKSFNIAYSVNTYAHYKAYVNGVLLDDSDFPFIFDLPSTTATSRYTLNGSDSLTFEGDVFAGPADPSGGPSVPVGLMGAKISWSGDTLFLKSDFHYTRQVTDQGVNGILSGSTTSIVKLKRL